MNYYFINSDDGSILESGDYSPGEVEEQCQVWADTCDCDVWVIQGQHAGIACSPAESGTIPPDAIACRRLTKSQVEQQELEHRKLIHWQLHGSLAGFGGG